jgi:ribosome-associated heat shock protein Hsp15
MTTEHVRIDKWLWAARFFKTRSLATDAIELGRVRIAGERIKPAREARIGEALEIAIGEQRLEVVVQALSAVRGAAYAPGFRAVAKKNGRIQRPSFTSRAQRFRR